MVQADETVGMSAVVVIAVLVGVSVGVSAVVSVGVSVALAVAAVPPSASTALVGAFGT